MLHEPMKSRKHYLFFLLNISHADDFDKTFFKHFFNDQKKLLSAELVREAANYFRLPLDLNEN